MSATTSKLKNLLKTREPRPAAPASDPKGPLAADETLPVPDYSPEVGAVPALMHSVAPAATDWYPGPMIGAQAIGRKICETGAGNVHKALALLERLEKDDYSRFMIDYYRDGLERFGDTWGYADLVTVLLGLAPLIRPRAYLEIGVRRGRSVCAVATEAPNCDFVMFDMWQQNYAGMENPGPELVAAELTKVGHTGRTEFVNGNSRETLPEYFNRNPEACFDIITVDGDHTNQGAARDLANVLPHLAVGGAVVFDDVCHPKLLGLKQVWSRMVADDRRFSTWIYDDVGYGVAFAIRKF